MDLEYNETFGRNWEFLNLSPNLFIKELLEKTGKVFIFIPSKIFRQISFKGFSYVLHSSFSSFSQVSFLVNFHCLLHIHWEGTEKLNLIRNGQAIFGRNCELCKFLPPFLITLKRSGRNFWTKLE